MMLDHQPLFLFPLQSIHLPKIKVGNEELTPPMTMLLKLRENPALLLLFSPLKGPAILLKCGHRVDNAIGSYLGGIVVEHGHPSFYAGLDEQRL